MGAIAKSASAEKRGKTKTRSKHQLQKTYKEKNIDDIILLDDEDEFSPALETSSLQNVGDSSVLETSSLQNVGDSSVSSAQNDNKDEHNCSTDGAESDNDDDIEMFEDDVDEMNDSVTED